MMLVAVQAQGEHVDARRSRFNGFDQLRAFRLAELGDGVVSCASLPEEFRRPESQERQSAALGRARLRGVRPAQARDLAVSGDEYLQERSSLVNDRLIRWGEL